MKDPLPASDLDLKLAEAIELPALSWLTGTSAGSGFAEEAGSRRALGAASGWLGALG
jgi:hypothetical protein